MLSVATGLPFMTIRDQPKTGRVGNADTIGRLVRGEKTVIIDDVVTDGESKIAPARACIAAGVDLGPLVVLVDRQQGWQKKFAAEELDLEVWAGMTLHDVRRRLIENGIMERCPKTVEDRNPIIVSFDGMEWSEILPIVDQLRTTGCKIKVNDLMVWEGYKNLIPDLQVYGDVMVDLKGHDIPNTLKNISTRFATNPPWAVTVHASGGTEMIRAVVDAFKGTPTKVMVVTVLTSMDEATCEEIYHRLPWSQVQCFAKMAVSAGAGYLVCATEHLAKLKPEFPHLGLVSPGIRSLGVDPGDQKQIGTPTKALQDGALFLVMGRQIFGAPAGPVAEVNRLLKEEVKITL